MSPYIKQEHRKALDLLLKEFNSYTIASYGEMNYVITKILLDCLPCASYQDYQAIIGLLECVKQEFYRKRVAHFEDEKCKLNGEVYE